MSEIYDLLSKAKAGDKNSVLEIVTKFDPLLNKYSRKLIYDGAKTDLIICLLEIIKNIPIHINYDLTNDERIVGYISSCIKHKYIHLSKKNSLIINSEVELNTDILEDSVCEDTDSQLFIQELLDKLPEYQKQIIKSIYIDNIPESTLAKKMNVSRQAVNKTKNRALSNLRKKLN